MEFRILGPLQVLDGDTPVEIAGSKRRAVLALLILRANEVVRSEWLIEELWGERPPANAAAALHNHVSRLRKALGPDVLARREWGYVLRVPPDLVDLHCFDRLVAEAEQLPARERSAKLGEALGLWRGPPLADLVNEPALERDIARLEELRLSAVERRIDADLETGCNSQLVGELEGLIAEHPLREHLRWQLILALYRGGRQAEALEVYRETRRVLADELGLDPSPALRELERAILRQDPSLAVAARPPDAGPPPEHEPPRSRKRALLLGLLGAFVLASGAAAAVALDRSHGPARQPASLAPRVVTETIAVSRTFHRERRANPRLHRTSARHVVKSAPSKPTKSAPVRTHTLTTARTVRSTKTTTAMRSRAEHTTTSRKRTVKSHKLVAKKPPPPKLVTVADSFDGDLVDPTIWSTICCDGTGSSVAERGGRLEYTFAPYTTTGGPWNIAGGHVGTQCKFPSDFDARVDFSLAEWPPKNGVVASLIAWFGPENIGTQVNRTSNEWGDTYNAWLDPTAPVGVPLPDTSGSLRLARKNGLVTAYFLHNGTWRKLSTRRLYLAATLALGASVGQTFAGQEVVVDFDNFTVTGADPACPAASQPSG